MKRVLYLQPLNGHNVAGLGRFIHTKRRLKKINLFFQKDVAGMKKGFYICTRLTK
jgi:hypothetical protein